MTDVSSISFAIDPSNVPSFLLDWEVTKKCNLDCSYCEVGIDGGHDNSIEHPPLNDCLQTIDFMYKYVDLYMQYRKISQRKVILNIYGGESLFHPNIVEIIQECRKRYLAYKDNWFLTITCTTNGIVGTNQWKKIVPLIDEFTVSYHSENLPKQKEQYKKNILYLQQQNKRFKCVIMMHNKQELFKDSELVIQFCKDNNIRYVSKPLDNYGDHWKYSQEQFSTLKTFWINVLPSSKKEEYSQMLDQIGKTNEISSISEGRPCCGGRKLSLNGDLKSCVSYVPKQNFTDWYCSVNWFFLFVQQVTKKIYTNKDCKMSLNSKMEPLGTIDQGQELINSLSNNLKNNTMPIIQCKKELCMCGFCAPKAKDKDMFLSLIKRNVHDVFIKN